MDFFFKINYNIKMKRQKCWRCKRKRDDKFLIHTRDNQVVFKVYECDKLANCLMNTKFKK